MTVANRVFSNVLVSDRELNVQLEIDPVSTIARNARVSREFQSNVRQCEAARVRAVRRRRQRLEDRVNMAKAIRIGALTCELMPI
jgi:hypothetical protein